MQKYFLGAAVLFLPLVMVNAADDGICSIGSIAMPASTPTTQFSISADNLVAVDKKTGLMWMRCTYGYEWDGETCVDFQGTATRTWLEALQIASDTDTVGGNMYLGYYDWRLPNLKELATIVERKCKENTINNNVFPGTARAMYWTNTHVFKSSDDVRTVNFSDGSMSTSAYTAKLNFRMVRDAN